MAWYFWIGLLAAGCIAGFSIPQLIKIIKNKNTSSISLLMFILMVCGNTLFVISAIGMLIAGDISGGLPLLFANLIAAVSAGIILFFKARNLVWAQKLGMKESDFCQDWISNSEKAKAVKGMKTSDKSNSSTDQSLDM